MSDSPETTPSGGTPSDAPEHDGTDLHLLREAIDHLQEVPAQEMVSPTPETLLADEPAPHPTDAIGSEDWGKDEPDHKS